ncbi:MAG: hypothetical protein ACOCT9_00070 [archaeon]
MNHLGGNKNSIGNFHLDTSNVLVSFGPPKLTNTNTSNKAITVGLIQNLSINQQRQIIKLFDYGSDEYEIVGGKWRHNIQINRILFDGPSVLKFIAYAYFDEEISQMMDHDNEDKYKEFVQKLYDNMGYEEDEIPTKEIPGTGDFWFNITSDLFNNPIGIFITIQQKLPTGESQNYGGVFLENCLISNHSLTMNPNNRILTEQISMEFGQPVPLKNYNGNQIALIEEKLKEIFRGDN